MWFQYATYLFGLDCHVLLAFAIVIVTRVPNLHELSLPCDLVKRYVLQYQQLFNYKGVSTAEIKKYEEAKLDYLGSS
jgi:predicted DNA-binding protein (UPF0278 family)